MTKSYLLLADKRGYGLAGERVSLTQRQAEFLLLSGAIAEIQDTDTALPAPAPAETGNGEPTGPRARKVKPG